ncbi:MAG TPA: hypothetical protein PK771_16145, partial [Spirochaetota bacterium]|nr:hypothetical protein [Spirochaetota bacterium]
TSDIFPNDNEYLYQNFGSKDVYLYLNSVTGDKENKDRFDVISPPTDLTNDKYKGTISRDQISDIDIVPNVLSDYYSRDSFRRDVKSFQLVLNFSNGQKKIIAGWPKHYYSKISNVVYYGFAYEYDYDKKAGYHDPWASDRSSDSKFCFFRQDASGDIVPIGSNTIYSLKVTINNIDDIKIEVLPETGTPIPIQDSTDDYTEGVYY